MKTRVADAPTPYDGEPEPRFLSIEDVLHLHQTLMARFGGDPGLLNPGALESAIAQPRMSAFGQLIHPTLIEQTAAYLFHLVANHPFCDGNKRIGLFAALVFLQDNGAKVGGSQDDWYELTMAVARGELTKRSLVARMTPLITRG